MGKVVIRDSFSIGFRCRKCGYIEPKKYGWWVFDASICGKCGSLEGFDKVAIKIAEEETGYLWCKDTRYYGLEFEGKLYRQK